MIHLYFGDGKGKTTAAIGLAMRMAGSGKKVLFFQFLKDNSSSERLALKGVKNITLVSGCEFKKPSWELSDKEIFELSAFYENVIDGIDAQQYDMIILDECMAAVNFGYIKKETILDFIKSHYDKCEIILTGRDPKPEFLELADYASEIRNIKHPYDKGVIARKGIEF